MPITLKNYIAGSWVDGAGARIASMNPATSEETVASGAQVTSEQLEAAIDAAHGSARPWRSLSIHERAAILHRAGELLSSAADDLGLELTREEGKTLAEGTGEVRRAAAILQYYAGLANHVSGETFDSLKQGEKILVQRRPLGTVGIVTPFNFPIAIPAWKLAPALLYGNSVVWKPASTVPLLAMRLAQAFERAGLPEGVLNLVIGPGRLGSELAEDPRIDGFSFTGSTGVGRRLAVSLAERGIPFQGELGGKNAAVVLADANLESAAQEVLRGAFRSTGQKCTATSRLIVEEPVADAFLDHLSGQLSQWVTGSPTDSRVDMGPLISADAREEVKNVADRAVREGAETVIRATDGEGAYTSEAFMGPRVIRVHDETNVAWREELFGPVLTLRTCADAEEAFEFVNDSEFGLSASVFTSDLGNTLRAMEEIDVGVLHLNSETAGADPHVPFGGNKRSGYGPKEQGLAAKEFYTQTTTVYLSGP